MDGTGMLEDQNGQVIAFKRPEPKIPETPPEESEAAPEPTALDDLKRVVEGIEKIGPEHLKNAIVVLQYDVGFAVQSIGNITALEALGAIAIGKEIILNRMMSPEP